MAIKIVVLDIDGVLNCQSMYEGKEEIIPTRKGKLSKRCLDALNDITDDTGAKIVVSSTWRSDPDIEEYLLEIGVRGEIIGKTPHLGGRFSFRGNEIYAWLHENEHLIGKPYHEYHSYVILDDDSDMLYWQRENFFHCDAYSGLTLNTAYKVKRFLNRY